MSSLSRKYRVRHETSYQYGADVVHSHHLLHLVPRPAPYQECVEHELRVVPESHRRVDGLDAFGNPLIRIELAQPHRELTVVSQMQIEVHPRPAVSPETTTPWDKVRDSFAYRGAWPGRDQLADEDNRGLWLRLDASIFELDRFQALSIDQIERMVATFQQALNRQLVEPFGLHPIEPYAPGHEGEARSHPIEMRTLATIDISSLPEAHTFDEAVKFHKSLALAGLRLGQPVRSVRTPEGGWAGTIRIGPPMPQFVAWARLGEAAMAAELNRAMAEIADALVSHRIEEAA